VPRVEGTEPGHVPEAAETEPDDDDLTTTTNLTPTDRAPVTADRRDHNEGRDGDEGRDDNDMTTSTTMSASTTTSTPPTSLTTDEHGVTTMWRR